MAPEPKSARKGRSTKRWRIVVVASLVLAFAFVGVYDALYGEVASMVPTGRLRQGTTFEDSSNASCPNEIHPDTAPCEKVALTRLL